ncbi:GntR family transcriptional regulator [Marinomonas sp. SBI22]|uniref:phosphonate utilization transcriptional regulator PhnR n=1 Tax=unclassified Marinomonas TaxID=196814 RepID=UPI0007AF99E4|nr:MULTISPECIES: phosphonate utilization transcriptional regulator PhnR [unclassified Marinomonas]KZM44304.1 GntR family transcriptional regulator [Marinomonas sp. SBI22]KZM45462.1 GntR family transcriptional regulator [Marinomonas sp. SBI8L]
MQYLKIMESINEQIEAGLLAPGSKFPAERKLAETFNTSRVTLREALSLLESDGKIFREDRRGWFVSPTALAYDPTNTDNFKTMAIKAKREPRSELLNAELLPCPRDAAKLLGVEAFTQVYKLERLRFLDNRPVAVTINYVIAEYFPELQEKDFIASLTHTYKEDYDILYSQTRYHIRTSSLQGEIAQALRATSGSPAMLVERVNHDQNGRLIDCDLEYWRHDAINIQSVATLIKE